MSEPRDINAVVEVIAVRAERTEMDVREMKDDLKKQATHYVPRGEFEARMTGTDREIVALRSTLTAGLADMKVAHEKSMQEIRDELKSSRISWHNMIAPGIGAITLIILLITTYTR